MRLRYGLRRRPMGVRDLPREQEGIRDSFLPNGYTAAAPKDALDMYERDH